MSSKDKRPAHKPKVSVLSITYNQEKYVRQALDSFVEQKTDFPFEVVIADDCSTDNTPKIIAEYASAYPDLFRIIPRKKNIGSWPNFIDALNRTKGDYIALCEGDDYWTDPKKLQLQADFLDKNPDHAICFHPVKVFFEGHPQEKSIYPDENLRSDLSTLALLKNNFIQTNSVMYRRQDYSKLPDSVIPGDWYLHLYHAQFGKIGFIDRTMAAYRRHAGGLWWAKNDQEFWRKNGLRQLDMYQKVLRLYGDKKEYRLAVQEPINRAFKSIANLPTEGKNNPLLNALTQYPEMSTRFIKAYMKESDKHAQDLEYLLSSSNTHIKKLEALNNDQQEHIRSITLLLQDITSSKSWKAVTKLRKIKKGIGR
jgi:glycosyltransferase involved in cell wall biosynthesis